jgi:hypothetical protein
LGYILGDFLKNSSGRPVQLLAESGESQKEEGVKNRRTDGQTDSRTDRQTDGERFAERRFAAGRPDEFT